MEYQPLRPPGLPVGPPGPHVVNGKPYPWRLGYRHGYKCSDMRESFDDVNDQVSYNIGFASGQYDFVSNRPDLLSGAYEQLHCALLALGRAVMDQWPFSYIKTMVRYLSRVLPILLLCLSACSTRVVTRTVEVPVPMPVAVPCEKIPADRIPARPTLAVTNLPPDARPPQTMAAYMETVLDLIVWGRAMEDLIQPYIEELP